MGYIKQVLNLLTLYRTRYPSFRHNDLHLSNILLKDQKVYFSDFLYTFVSTDEALGHLHLRGPDATMNVGGNDVYKEDIDAHFDIKTLLYCFRVLHQARPECVPVEVMTLVNSVIPDW